MEDKENVQYASQEWSVTVSQYDWLAKDSTGITIHAPTFVRLREITDFIDAAQKNEVASKVGENKMEELKSPAVQEHNAVIMNNVIALQERIRELESNQVKTDYQPIETAPKDGTVILTDCGFAFYAKDYGWVKCGPFGPYGRPKWLDCVPTRWAAVPEWILH